MVMDDIKQFTCIQNKQQGTSPYFVSKLFSIHNIHDVQRYTSTSLSSFFTRMLFLQASSKRDDVSTLRTFHFSGDFSTSQIDVAL